MKQIETAILVKQAKRENRLAQKELFLRYHPAMLRLAKRVVGVNAVAEDLLQDAFVKAFQSLHSLRDENYFGGWLKRIVVNESMDYMRGAKRFEEVEEVESAMIVAEQEEREWYLNFTFEEISQEIYKLPDGCRQIFTLYLLDEYKQRDIAKMTGLSISTVKSQYRYALSILRRGLQKKRRS